VINRVGWRASHPCDAEVADAADPERIEFTSFSSSNVASIMPMSAFTGTRLV
jgi:hypothetical protein